MSNRLSTTQRVGLAALWLSNSNHGLTPNELAARLGITPHGSRALLQRLSLALPLVTEPAEDGAERWRVLRENE